MKIHYLVFGITSFVSVIDVVASVGVALDNVFNFKVNIVLYH